MGNGVRGGYKSSTQEEIVFPPAIRSKIKRVEDAISPTLFLSNKSNYMRLGTSMPSSAMALLITLDTV